eukprot:13387508-Ditylum_brightwellii.AAC.1
MKRKCCTGQPELKYAHNMMTVICENTKKAMSSLSDKASCTAYERLKALEKEDEKMNDMDEIDVAHQN